MLKQLILLFLTSLLFCFTSNAQSRLEKSLKRSYYTYIYQLQNDEAARIYATGPHVVTTAYFHTLIDSFAVRTPYKQELPDGHYLFLHSSGPQLVYDLQTIAPVDVKMMQTGSDVAVLVHDKQGNSIPDAEVKLGNKKAVFDATTRSYWLKNAPDSGLLSIRSGDISLFRKLEKAESYTYNRSWLNKLIYSFPLKYVWFPFRDIYKSVRWYPVGWVRSFLSVFDPQYRKNSENKYKGYLVTNKPKYLPGDTVKYKTFVVDEDGDAVKGKAFLQVSRYNMQPKKLGEVKAYRKGGYEGYFILHDSLKLDLDRQYSIQLMRSGKKPETFASGSFYFEDYELKENTYTLALKHKDHQAGQENVILARGTGANGMNLLDARVEVVVTTRSIKETKEPLVFVPDTLWVHQQPLDAAGETSIVLPDSIMPEATIDYSVTATFLNASNERSVETANATYTYTKGILSFTLMQDSLLLEYLEGGKSKPLEAKLLAFDQDYNELSAQELQLPARVPISAYAEIYEAEAGNLDAYLDLSEKQALINLQASRSDDSLYIGIENPRQLPFWYFVYRGNKLVGGGQGNEPVFYLQQKVSGKKAYFVTVQYLWAGEMRHLKQDAPHHKYQLAIDLQAPAVVYPGQQADMKVTVRNASGKPVAGVDLTTYAFTSKFKSYTLPNLPSWDTYKRQKNHTGLYLEDPGTNGKKLMDWDYWSHRMGLDSIAYYNFLYPETGLFTSYSATQDSITQVSPFVVDSGRVVPVHVVYIDKVPVYFSQTNVLPVYSFAADSGYHTLELRTTDKLIKLDSVYLKPKHRLVISADITASSNPFASAAPYGALSDYERNRLYKYLLHVEHDPRSYTAYLKQGNRIMLLAGNEGFNASYYKQALPYLVGPVSPDWTKYVRLNSFTTNFMMEPDYLYQFEPGLLKMRELEVSVAKAILPAWSKFERETNLLHQETLTERSIQENWESAQKEYLLGKMYASNSGRSRTAGTGRIGWELQDSVRQQVKLIFLHPLGQPDSLAVYPRESRTLHNIEPATYQLTLLLQNNEIAARELHVKPNGQTHISFTVADVTPATEESKYLQNLVEVRIKQLKILYKEKLQEEQLLQRVAQQAAYTYTNGSEQYSHEVTGIITDKETGEPLPGVTVLLEGTTIGAVTDVQGRYRLFAPANGVLSIRFIGYDTAEEALNGRDKLDVALEVNTQQLSEVVVVGYGIEKRNSATASVATALQGSVAGVRIRGVSSISAADAKPLLIVNGVPFNGEQADLDASTITSTTVLDKDAATALYGAAGAAGVIIITTSNKALLASGPDQGAETAHAIRNNFSDYAIWQSRLITDEAGEATFTATFPDDITSWSTYVLAMDNRKHSGMFTTNIKSFKAMMATLHLPRFLVEGDEAYVVGKALNYLPDSAQVTTKFEVNGEAVKSETKLLTRSFTDTLKLRAPALAPDSLAVQYSLVQESGFADGEKRYIGVYKKGVEETIGQFLSLNTDTTFTLTFNKANGPVTLHTQGNMLEVMLDEIDHLYKYEYWCSEQAASKLIALLMEKRIRKQLGQDFEHEKDIKRLIRHLEKTQLDNGAWTWWENGPAYPWITNHVLKALTMARAENFDVKIQEEKISDYLVYLLESGASADKLSALEMLHRLKAEVDYPRYVKELEKKQKLSQEEQFRLMRLRQQFGLPVQLDSLQRTKRHTVLGGIYWGEENRLRLFNNNITNTLLAYQVLRAADGYEKELAQIRAYLLSERRTGHWRNTYESARILETLLPDLLQDEKGSGGIPANTLSFSGAVNFVQQGFRADTTFAPTKPLMVKKQGKLPVYLTAYQTIWNAAPQAVTKDFVVTTTLKGMGNQAVLQAGTPAEILVEVEVKADADYVMIEVPIPAGCSYESKSEGSSNEVHREYFRNKVSIFSDRLPKGKYTYSVKLLPRYTGTYTLNPAKAELMYFPTFYGRNELKQVLVK